MRLCQIAAIVLLSACQLALPGKGGDATPASPVKADQISVTSLDTPAEKPTPPEETPPVVADVPETATVVEDKPITASPAPPPKSAAQIACEKGRGNWVKAGKTGTMSCQTPLHDNGKQCRRDRDCEGQCLARSRTCAPFSPMFGCNEVLQDNGQRVTLCID